MRRDPHFTAAVTEWVRTHRRATYLLFAALGLTIVLTGSSTAGRGAIAWVAAPVLLAAGLAGLVAELICPGSTGAMDQPWPGKVILGAFGLSLLLIAVDTPAWIFFAVGSGVVAGVAVWAYQQRQLRA